MKKLIAIMVSAVMIFAMTATVFAAEAAAPEAAPAEEQQSITTQNISEMKASSFATNNSDTSRPQDEGKIYVGYAITDGALDAENSNWEGDVTKPIELANEVDGEGFTAVRAYGDTTASVTGTLILKDDSDGQVVSDFKGVGAAITGADGATIYVNDMNYYSEGFARSFAVVQNSTMVVTNSDITALGKNALTDAWDGYYNSANTSMMISPPWVLGIQGGIRGVNLLGVGSTLVVADSTVATGGWGVLSTDGCTSPYMYLYNSSLDVLPESVGGMNSGWEIFGYDKDAYGTGYGTFLIGGAVEFFYGMTVNGATYASILNGGDVSYEGLKNGTTYEAKAEDGTVVGSYTAKADVDTVINTVFGVMAFNTGTIKILEGATVNSAEDTILYKSGNPDITIDGGKVNPGNGIILEMIDNDDTTIGGFDPFGTYLEEDAGFKTEACSDADNYAFTTDTTVDPEKIYYAADLEEGYVVVENPTDEGTVAYYEKSSSGNHANILFANGEYAGDLYNATGYYDQAPDSLTVEIADTATLTGDIALATHVHGIWLNGRSVDDVLQAIDNADAYHEKIHGYYEGLDDIEYVFLDADGAITEDKDAAVAIQFTKFSVSEYYLVGHVLNMINYNGQSAIDVTVEGTWKPEAASLVTYLKIAEGAHVFGEVTVLDDGSILVVPSEEEAAAGEYGAVFEYIEGEGESSGDSGDSESEEAEAAEAEAAPEGESAEGESAEGESPEGEAPAEAAPAEEAPAGEAPAGDSPEGESAEGESPEGEAPAEEAPADEAPAGDSPEGESAEGESPEGESPAEAAPQG